MITLVPGGPRSSRVLGASNRLMRLRKGVWNKNSWRATTSFAKNKRSWGALSLQASPPPSPHLATPGLPAAHPSSQHPRALAPGTPEAAYARHNPGAGDGHTTATRMEPRALRQGRAEIQHATSIPGQEPARQHPAQGASRAEGTESTAMAAPARVAWPLRQGCYQTP